MKRLTLLQFVAALLIGAVIGVFFTRKNDTSKNIVAYEVKQIHDTIQLPSPMTGVVIKLNNGDTAVIVGREVQYVYVKDGKIVSARK